MFSTTTSAPPPANERAVRLRGSCIQCRKRKRKVFFFNINLFFPFTFNPNELTHITSSATNFAPLAVYVSIQILPVPTTRSRPTIQTLLKSDGSAKLKTSPVPNLNKNLIMNHPSLIINLNRLTYLKYLNLSPPANANPQVSLYPKPLPSLPTIQTTLHSTPILFNSLLSMIIRPISWQWVPFSPKPCRAPTSSECSPTKTICGMQLMAIVLVK